MEINKETLFLETRNNGQHYEIKEESLKQSLT